MICSICMRRFRDHTIEEATECTAKHMVKEVERTLEGKCIACGEVPDIQDPNTQEYWCHGCFSHYTGDR